MSKNLKKKPIVLVFAFVAAVAGVVLAGCSLATWEDHGYALASGWLAIGLVGIIGTAAAVILVTFVMDGGSKRSEEGDRAVRANLPKAILIDHRH